MIQEFDYDSVPMPASVPIWMMLLVAALLLALGGLLARSCRLLDGPAPQTAITEVP